MQWTELTVIKELRHTSRVKEPYDYQSVVIVREDHQGGIRNLRGMDYCHPGLHQNRRHERWTEAFLKHFERTVVPYDCNDGISPAELEAAALSKHFNAACRPGTWSMIESEDEELKTRFPRLCELCDNVEKCSYDSSASTNHAQALQCMRKSTNAVAYVALGEAIEFFESNPEIRGNFKYLCPNSSYQNITDDKRPCVWLTQPWTVIVSNIDNAIRFV
jgi:Transferrin